jgi:class 3 adenylate cyclase
MADTGTEKLYTILFADIAGSTALYEKLGDAAAQAQIGLRLDKIAGVVASFRGTVIKSIGDELMCRFDAPADAVQAACEIHELMERQTDTTGVRLATRIGIHRGTAIQQDNDLFGDAVNVAARVTALAKAEQTLATDATVRALPAVRAVQTRQLNRAAVKGKQETLDLHEVLWRHDNLTVLSGSRTVAAGAGDRLVLTYQGITRALERGAPALLLGRDPGCQLQVVSSLASRMHGKIEHRMGKFVFVDHSANGTYIRLPDIENLFLQREELPLFGSGVICCGEKITDASPHLIHFACE